MSRLHLNAVLAQIFINGVERLKGVGDLVSLALGAGKRRIGRGVGDDQDPQHPARRRRRFRRRREGGTKLSREAPAGTQKVIGVFELAIEGVVALLALALARSA